MYWQLSGTVESELDGDDLLRFQYGTTSAPTRLALPPRSQRAGGQLREQEVSAADHWSEA